MTVGAECQAPDFLRVAAERKNDLPRGGVPQPHGFVTAGRGDEATVGAVFDTNDSRRMSAAGSEATGPWRRPRALQSSHSFPIRFGGRLGCMTPN